jgi:hypothetical protein
MPTEHILALLIQERDKLNRAIEALQGGGARLGRPSKSPENSEFAGRASSGEPIKKRHVSAAARKKMAAAQKKRWAAKKAAK